MFGEFATSHSELTLYAAICQGLAHDAETAVILLAASPGQRRPVLWLAALHDLVLRDPHVVAARWFPSVRGSTVGNRGMLVGDPWPDVRQTVLDHRDGLTEVIATHSTQTNEVNRAVYLAPALAVACDDVTDTEVALVEMGASAGLLMLLDRYRIERRSAGQATIVGDPDSPVRCVGDDRSEPTVPATPLPRIGTRVGVDRNPVGLDDEAAVRWLEACLWPDVPRRAERFRAAVDLARQNPPTLVQGDMVDDLATVVALAQRGGEPGAHTVVFSSWGLTYVAREQRRRVGDVLARLAASGAPVSWVTAEPAGCAPGLAQPPGLDAGGDVTVLGVRRWRDGGEIEPIVVGSCHPHGAWVDLVPR